MGGKSCGRFGIRRVRRRSEVRLRGRRIRVVATSEPGVLSRVDGFSKSKNPGRRLKLRTRRFGPSGWFESKR
jgi:hypothetical protein